MESETLHELRRSIDRGRHWTRNTSIGFYVASAVVLLITIGLEGWQFYRAGPILVVGMLGLIGLGFQLWYRTMRWTHHPVLIAIESEPSAITRAWVMAATGKAALLTSRQVCVAAGEASIQLNYNVVDLPALEEALKAHCPEVSTNGFEPFQSRRYD